MELKAIMCRPTELDDFKSSLSPDILDLHVHVSCLSVRVCGSTLIESRFIPFEMGGVG